MFARQSYFSRAAKLYNTPGQWVLWTEVLLLFWTIPSLARAGGGPENLFLLVNSRSSSSKTIANHFVSLRKIPASNVRYIDWQGSFYRVSGQKFREQILKPALQSIEERGLTDQIDYLVYSSDFPYAVDFKNEMVVQKNSRSSPPGKVLTAVASLTGATYLWQLVLNRSPDTVSLHNNWYARSPYLAQGAVGSRSFCCRDRWGPEGERVTSGGRSYLLSTMLGVTWGRGNTVSEVIRYLTRAVAADSTLPRGTIYFVKHGGVRSKTRHRGYAVAASILNRVGVRAEVIQGRMLHDKPDIQGLMLGVASFDWQKTGNRILAGAICENLTSFGADFRAEASQNPLSEFLRFGAAGSSGAVVEPTAVAEKFPSPMVQIHYVFGCTLAEAFYQSVQGPYQLLIVGDPLCRPWAVPPRITVKDLRPGQTLRGKVTFEPQSTTSKRFSVSRFRLFVDGRQRLERRPGEPFVLETGELVDGYHQLRVVGIRSGPIQTQGEVVLPVVVDNHGHQIAIQAEIGQKSSSELTLKVTATSRGASHILILQNRRVIGKIEGEGGTVQIDPAALGSGPVVLTAESFGDGQALSSPIRVVIK